MPGVEVYAYACHPAVERWGRAWLERGRMECRFLKPVYDGRIAWSRRSESAAGLDLEVHSEGVLCATGHASLGDGAAKPPSIDAFEQRTPPPPQSVRRPAKSSLAEGTWLEHRADADDSRVRSADYLRDVRESRWHLCPRRPGPPRRRCCGCAIWRCGRTWCCRPGSTPAARSPTSRPRASATSCAVRARVAANYEKKGHRLVDLDALVIANGRTVVARVLHTAVYQLRQLA